MFGAQRKVNGKLGRYEMDIKDTIQTNHIKCEQWETYIAETNIIKVIGEEQDNREFSKEGG